MTDAYTDREQTKAKHFILKRYLQALAFKMLPSFEVTYIDGFSGPWETRTDDFADSSFMIAISTLKDAQQKILERTGKRPRVRCFFSEADPEAFEKLRNSVIPFHNPAENFEIRTFGGRFEDAIEDVQAFVGTSFPLIFIDPTGWTGYPFEKIKPLFARLKCEVLINFMYEFVNRFANSDDPETVASLDPILGGPGWRDRLDPNLPRGLAVEKLFRQTLKAVGNFDFVVSTKIDKSTAERPHFFIAYATKDPNGLKTFRQIEYDTLREHVKDRANAKERKREQRSGLLDLFAGHHANIQEGTVDEIVEQQKGLAKKDLLDTLPVQGPFPFSSVVAGLLQAYMLRETNIKDICVELAEEGRIDNTWGSGNRKPRDDDIIRLREP